MREEAVDLTCFRRAMGAFATGVTVVTVGSPDGTRYGMTVNAFSSVSLEPPLVLICLNRTGRGRELIERAGVFGVNVLAQEQQRLSQWFADRRRPMDAGMFEGIPMQLGGTGCPILSEAAASFDCRVHRVVDAGDHVIVLGAVMAVRHRPDRAPLVFHAGGYGSLADQAAAAGPARLRAV